MDERHVDENIAVEDNVHVAVCDTAILRWVEPCWDALPKAAKLPVFDDLAARDWGREESDHNVICDEFYEWVVDGLKQSAPEPPSITHLAVGTDGTSPSSTNDSLNAEHARVEVTEFIDQGTSLTTQALLAKEEANGASSDLVELSLLAEEYFLNHSLFSSINKTSSKAVRFEIAFNPA